jgi:hypothetical protein
MSVAMRSVVTSLEIESARFVGWTRSGDGSRRR